MEMKKLTCVFIALLTLLSAAAGCVKRKDPTADNPPKVPQSALATADSGTPATADEATGRKIQVSDSSLGDVWITEWANVPKSDLAGDNFTSDDTFKYYNVKGSSASMEGIDVSDFSGEIDWQKVKDAGVDFAMIRLGGRFYGEEGKMFVDENAVANFRGAQAAGIKAGGYFYSKAVNAEEARAEAQFLKAVLDDIVPDLPIAFDWEIVEDEEARNDTVDGAALTACARAFCDEVKSYGFEPMIYAPTRELYFKYDLSQLADVAVWVKEYNDTPTFYYRSAMWQYSDSGVIDGIEGTVDLDIYFTDPEKGSASE